MATLTDPHDKREEESAEKVLPSGSQGVQNRKFKCYCETSVDEEEHQLTFSYNTPLSKKTLWHTALF